MLQQVIKLFRGTKIADIPVEQAYSGNADHSRNAGWKWLLPHRSLQ
jgi:hypothetical protein